jgi:S1-C subfamily serine protease
VPHRPWLGADLQSVTPELAASLGLTTPSGVLAASVAVGGPAAAAGIKVGDLISTIDGETVDDLGSLNYRLATKAIGGQTKLGVMRAGKLYTATVALEAAPEKPARDKRTIGGTTAFSGATVLNLSPAVAEELGYNGTPNGVIISDVPAGSAAADAGFARGDVIAQVNGTDIDSTKTLVDILAEQRRYFDLVVKRGGQAMRLRMAG